MKKVVTVFIIMVLSLAVLIAADSIKVGVSMAAALPGGQYANDIVPSVAVGQKLNLKYTFSFKEDISVGSIFSGVKSFFGSKDNSYICALIHFDEVEDVSLVTKTNGANAVYGNESDYMIMRFFYDTTQTMFTFRWLLAAVKGFNMNTWGNYCDFRGIDSLDNMVASKGDIDKDGGMRYSLSISDLVAENELVSYLDLMNTYSSYSSIRGKYYMILLPYKNKGTYEVEFQLDSQNVTADKLSVDMYFIYLENYINSSIPRNLMQSGCYYLPDSNYAHTINIK